MYKDFISPEFQTLHRQYEQQKHLMEIETLFKNYLQTMGLDSTSPVNSFVATFYNKYPQGLSK